MEQKQDNQPITNERQIRLQKLETIKNAGIDPYPPKFERLQTLADAIKLKEGQPAKVAGRIMTMRVMGKIAFLHLQDESGKMQLVLNAKEIDPEGYKFFIKNFDLGDFVGVEGEIFTTKKGEVSVLVKDYTLLSKALRPLPEKWHGIKDDELRLQKRYLDFIANPDLKELFYRKNIFWQACRSFLTSKGFLEVETPVLETSAGGADADPFITHHNALDIDVYLRISMGELWQKRLMVAGFEKTFEIGRQFRNEGMSREHLQDYTQMECYWAYTDYEDMMKLTEAMYKFIIKETYGKSIFEINGHKVNFDTQWQKIDYRQTVLDQSGVDIETASDKEIKEKLKSLKVKFDPNLSRARLIDTLWKQYRTKIAGPVFLINHPVEVSPLAKRDPKNPKNTQRFQVILAGSEMGNGYSELNDPVDQAGRFEEQAKMREAGDSEAQMHDRDFVEALEHGMPPVSGFGFSERLFSFLENKTARECQLFPLVRPKK